MDIRDITEADLLFFIIILLAHNAKFMENDVVQHCHCRFFFMNVHKKNIILHSF